MLTNKEWESLYQTIDQKLSLVNKQMQEMQKQLDELCKPKRTANSKKVAESS